MENLPIQSLDQQEILNNFIDYLKNQDVYKGYNFEGSNIRVILDLLNYATYYNGFYQHMISNEMFLDSCSLYESAISKAKFKNYVPRSKVAATANVRLYVDIDQYNEPPGKRIIIKRGTSFRSNNTGSDTRAFTLIDDVYIFNRSLLENVYNYNTDEVILYEGIFKEYRFLVDSSIEYQRFIIKDSDIDIRTLRVNVYENVNSDNYITYTQPENYMTVDGNSNIFYLTVNEYGYYELLFGNDVWGKSLSNNNYISCTYVRTSGIDGNNAKVIVLDNEYDFNGNPYSVSVEVLEKSSGGNDKETLDEMKFNIPNHYRRQNRAVQDDDFKGLLIEKFANINSINVWGGETNVPKEYGKTFICIKPKFGEKLSTYTKSYLEKEIISGYAIPSREVEFVNPDYLYIKLELYVKYNPTITSKAAGEIKSLIIEEIEDYDENYLNKFDSYFSSSLLNEKIIDLDRSILTSEAKIKLEKKLTIALNSSEDYSIDFTNKIVPGTLKTNSFIFRYYTCYAYDDEKGNILVDYYNENNNWVNFTDETFGSIGYEEGFIRFSNLIIADIANNILNVNVQPYYDNFFTVRNNVVTVKDISVNLNEKIASINYKK